MLKSYCERLTTIVLLLRECHGEHIRVKELDSTAKACFYSGLHEQYEPLVVHLKDKVHTTTSDLLRAICAMRNLNRTYEIEGTTIHPINLSMMQHTNLDRINKSRKLKVTLPKPLNCPMKNSQNMQNHQKPLTWTKTLNTATTKELFKQRI